MPNIKEFRTYGCPKCDGAMSAREWNPVMRGGEFYCYEVKFYCDCGSVFVSLEDDSSPLNS